MTSLVLIAALAGCGPSPEPLTLVASDAPVSTTAVFYDKIAYGPHTEDTFDLFLPPGDGPFPLVFQVHGGGFTAGAADDLYGEDNGEAYINGFIAQGIAVANVDYRLLDEVDDTGVIKSLGDVRYCLQFIRWHAEQLQIDPTRIAGDGTSAGAGTVIWLDTHPDVADPKNDDPVLRQSSRLIAANGEETQASYDLYRWETDVFAEYGITIALQAQLGFEQQILSFYGATSLGQLQQEPFVSYRADVDMLALESSDDGAIRVENVNIPDAFPTSVDALYHHPRHTLALQTYGLAAGMDVKAHIPSMDIDDGVSQSDFLIGALQ